MNNWIQKIFCPDIVILCYLMDNQFIHVLNILNFPVFVSFLKIYIKYPRVIICVKLLHWMSWCFCYWYRIQLWGRCEPSIISFSSLKNLISCSLHKNISPEHGKICPSFINMENYWKGKVTTQKSLVLKSCIILDFHSEYSHLPHVYILVIN